MEYIVLFFGKTVQDVDFENKFSQNSQKCEKRTFLTRYLEKGVERRQSRIAPDFARVEI